MTLPRVLIAALVLLPACTARELEWKTPPDPEIVAFSIDDAVSVTQELVSPPFLPPSVWRSRSTASPAPRDTEFSGALPQIGPSIGLGLAAAGRPTLPRQVRSI